MLSLPLFVGSRTEDTVQESLSPVSSFSVWLKLNALKVIINPVYISNHDVFE